ncbi:TPA: thioesterase II family protein [Streptococcus agalactiae]|nr:thioesterase [Streptococcus agalactiae]
MKIILLSHAGGSATLFFSFLKEFLNEKEMKFIDYRGHGSRITEVLCDNFDEMINDVLINFLENVDPGEKYLIIGHSLGAYIGFHLEKILETKFGYQAKNLLISGIEPIEYPILKLGQLSELTDEKFISEIERFGGLEPHLFQNEDFKEFALPILRSDFKVIESMNNRFKKEIVKSPITVVNGTNDKYEIDNLLRWKLYSDNNVEFIFLNGGHFYINENKKEFAEIVKKLMREEK